MAPLVGLAAHAATGSPAPAATQPPAAFAQCKACHSVDPGGKSGIGPNLFAVGGKIAGTKPGYAYSPAMKASRKRWDRANLDAYLANPKGLVPGTKMMTPGVSDAKKRKELVDYLMALN
ncbi:c-type cytochrome [Sphingomonas suaedae]|uniref:C-type cytochrome n=2 Tax=Sphingomonas suaedae TaxID=2599297 RepID=A0A518RLP3_9SPHN|nr:c-type cytochrome [Sphingomonas suaedae]